MIIPVFTLIPVTDVYKNLVGSRLTKKAGLDNINPVSYCGRVRFGLDTPAISTKTSAYPLVCRQYSFISLFWLPQLYSENCARRSGYVWYLREEQTGRSYVVIIDSRVKQEEHRMVPPFPFPF